MSKKVLGIIFIVLAVLLTIAILPLIPIFIKGIYLVKGDLDSTMASEVIGQLCYAVVHIIITIFLWKFGLKWIKKPSSSTL